MIQIGPEVDKFGDKFGGKFDHKFDDKMDDQIGDKMARWLHTVSCKFSLVPTASRLLDSGGFNLV